MCKKIMAIDRGYKHSEEGRKLYQHGEKEIKLLSLRDGYSKTRSDINYVRVCLHFHPGSS